MKRTKIICTIGPSSANKEVLTRMIENGMNIARINFSHGTYEEQADKMALIKEVRQELSRSVPIMLDTKGPEYRIGKFEKKKIYLSDGDSFTFTTRDIVGSQDRVSVSYKQLPGELEAGDIILVNDGLVKFEVVSVTETDVNCVTVIGGKLSDTKSMSFPGKTLKQVFLSEQDKQDLIFGIKNGIEYVACSFVSTPEDMRSIREFLDSNGGEHINTIAKIENQSGVDNAEEILRIADGLMVARGDLGVEVPFYKLPSIQKMLLRTCNEMGRFSVTATEMLESMTEKPRPTRAEVSDVANAVFDGSQAIMLSGETANGKYPAEAVNVMAMVAEDAEKHISKISYDL